MVPKQQINPAMKNQSTGLKSIVGWYPVVRLRISAPIARPYEAAINAKYAILNPNLNVNINIYD